MRNLNWLKLPFNKPNVICATNVNIISKIQLNPPDITGHFATGNTNPFPIIALQAFTWRMENVYNRMFVLLLKRK